MQLGFTEIKVIRTHSALSTRNRYRRHVAALVQGNKLVQMVQISKHSCSVPAERIFKYMYKTFSKSGKTKQCTSDISGSESSEPMISNSESF